MVECSESKNPTTHTSTMATTLASNYWTATAITVAVYPEPTQHPDDEETDAVKDYYPDDDHNHKFGLCPMCKIGLDDKSEFTFNYADGSERGTMMCWDCDAKQKPKKLKFHSRSNCRLGTTLQKKFWRRFRATFVERFATFRQRRFSPKEVFKLDKSSDRSGNVFY